MVAARWKETDMTLIRVNPASVQTYGTTAQATFEAMRGTLESLVDGRVVNPIRVDPDVAHHARVALDQMLALPGETNKD